MCTQATDTIKSNQILKYTLPRFSYDAVLISLQIQAMVLK